MLSTLDRSNFPLSLISMLPPAFLAVSKKETTVTAPVNDALPAIVNFLLPKILEAIKKGKAYPQMYTESMDRYLYDYQNKKELYGTYTRKKKYFIYPQKIDSIRKSIGLPSLTYNNWRIKAKYGIELNN